MKFPEPSIEVVVEYHWAKGEGPVVEQDDPFQRNAKRPTIVDAFLADAIVTVTAGETPRTVARGWPRTVAGRGREAALDERYSMPVIIWNREVEAEIAADAQKVTTGHGLALTPEPPRSRARTGGRQAR